MLTAIFGMVVAVIAALLLVVVVAAAAAGDGFVIRFKVMTDPRPSSFLRVSAISGWRGAVGAQ